MSPLIVLFQEALLTFLILSSTVSSTYLSKPTLTTPCEYINSLEVESQILEKILGNESSYDKKIRPSGPLTSLNVSGPTAISVSLHIRSIENIDDVRMQYSVQLTFRQEWIDPRLKYSHIQDNICYLPLALDDKIWVPDLFFSNEKHGTLHHLVTPNQFTRIFPNGTVLQSYRFTLLLSCPMDLRSYPLDEQECPIQMASYGWTTKDIILKWQDSDEPVKMAMDYTLPRFRIQKYSWRKPCMSITSSGNYSCIRLDISFKRQFEFYLIQIYVPCSMLSLVSWVTFWLEPTAVEARVSLGVTTILAIVTQTYGINQSAPPASYVKAMDVWTAFCQAMVFGSLLEFAMVNYITHFRVIAKAKRILFIREEVEMKRRIKLEEKLLADALIKAKTVDRVARGLFPCIFLIFNIAYWSYYLQYFPTL